MIIHIDYPVGSGDYPAGAGDYQTGSGDEEIIVVNNLKVRHKMAKSKNHYGWYICDISFEY